jgi:hypothetical protein
MKTDFWDATDEFQKYRLILRDIWNQYLWSEPEFRDWDMANHFESLRPTFFNELLGEKLRRRMDIERDDPLTIYVAGAVTEGIRARGTPIRISETLDRGSRCWTQPPGYVRRPEMLLKFLDFFDWGICEYRDLRYFLVEIAASSKYPDLVCREALVDVDSAHVFVVTGERHPEADMAALNELET